MRLLIVVWIAAFVLPAYAEPNAVYPEFVPGKEIRLNVGKAVGEILVYVPTDYNDDCNWPAIFYYHGAGEPLSTQRFQISTQGRGFVVVSMEFAPTTDKQKTLTQYLAYVELEIKNLAFVRHYLQKRLKINNKMTVLAGVSRGGWLASDIFALRPQLGAAAVIMCAGYSGWASENISSSLAGKYVYIGTGETDQNRPAAKKAANYFESCNADVTFDVYAGLGHNVDPNSPKLKKWFSDLRKNMK